MDTRTRTRWLALGRRDYLLAAAAAGLAAIDALAAASSPSDPIDPRLAAVARLVEPARRALAAERRETAGLIAALPSEPASEQDPDARETIGLATDLARAELALAVALDLDPAASNPRT